MQKRTLATPPPGIDLQNSLSKCMLNYLHCRIGQNISIPEMESSLGFKFRDFLYKEQRSQFNTHADPFFAENAFAKLVESLETFFYSLPYELSTLPGLHASQTTQLLQTQLAFTRRMLSTEIIPILSGNTSDSSFQALEAKLAECEKDVSIECILNLKHLFKQQSDALRALQCIHACIRDETSFVHLLFRHADDLNALALYPPKGLVAFFAHHEAVFEEVAEYMRLGSQNGVRGASGLEPNGSTKELGIGRWVCKHKNIFACHGSEIAKWTTVLEALASKPVESVGWHGIELSDSLNGSGWGTKLAPLSHMHYEKQVYAWNETRLYTVSATSKYWVNCCLLSTRVFFVLRHLVARRILNPLNLKCEILLASASRWRLQVDIATLPTTEEEAPPDEAETAAVEEETGETEEEEAEVEADFKTQTTQIVGTAAGRDRDGGSGPSAPSTLPMQLAFHQVTIPISLERDHAILEHVNFLLQAAYQQACAGPSERLTGVVVIETKAVVDRILLHSGHLKAGSASTASQWVSIVFSKLLLHSDGDSCGCVLYKRGDPWPHAPCARPTASCLVAHKKSVVDIIGNVSELLRKMQFDHTFANSWFSSKSAKSRSKKARYERKNGAAASVSEFSLVLG